MLGHTHWVSGCVSYTHHFWCLGFVGEGRREGRREGRYLVYESPSGPQAGWGLVVGIEADLHRTFRAVYRHVLSVDITPPTAVLCCCCCCPCCPSLSYTGEDGFELSIPNSHMVQLAEAMVADPEVGTPQL